MDDCHGLEIGSTSILKLSFCFCCYLSDLAVDESYQNHGIGKRLIELTQEKIGPSTTLLLLAAPTAMGYYPKVGFEAVPNGWTIKRTQ